KICENLVPTEDATTVAKLYRAGGVLLGKLATHEFAHGGPSFDLPWPPARNPWNRDHFTGGSSSGAGAAVAAGFVPGALGSDTGGSIRGPAALCGIVGLKPTYGLVSRAGVYANSFTFDHAGPMTWTVEDCAIMLQAIAGHDPVDPASAARPIPDYRAALTGDFGADFLGRALPAVLYSGTDYVQAQRERRRMLAEMAPIYEKYDLLLTPTAPGPAPRLGTWRTISFWQNSSLTTPSPGVRHSHNAWGSRRLACRCRCSWSGARSTTRRCCTPRMLTKRRRTGEAAGPVSTRVRGSRPNCRRALGRSLSTTRRCATSSWRPAGLPNCR